VGHDKEGTWIRKQKIDGYTANTAEMGLGTNRICQQRAEDSCGMRIRKIVQWNKYGRDNGTEMRKIPLASGEENERRKTEPHWGPETNGGKEKKRTQNGGETKDTRTHH